MKWQALITGCRDLGSMALGLWGIWYQQTTGQVNVWLLAVYTTMLGIPGAIGLVQLGRGAGKQATEPTPSSSAPSPSQPSSSL